MAAEPEDSQEELLRTLKSTIATKRRDAAKQLGSVPISSRNVVEALLKARDTDWDNETRLIAAGALAAPVHQAVIQQNPDLMALLAQPSNHPLPKLIQTLPPAAQTLSDPEPISILPSLPWYVIWQRAVFKPTLETYEQIARDPDATRNRAYRWLFISGLFLGVFALLIGSAHKYNDPAYAGIGLQSLFSLSGLCLSLFFSLAEVIGVAIQTAICNFIARRFGGEGNYGHLLYTIAAYSCPLIFISLALSNILLPVRGIVSLVLNIFQIYLVVLAIKAVHRIGWKQAIITGAVVQGAFLVFSLLAAQMSSLPRTG